MSEKQNDINLGFVIGGLALMIVSALIFVFMPEVGIRSIIGLGLIFVIGLGLTVAGSPDPNQKKDNDAGPM